MMRNKILKKIYNCISIVILFSILFSVIPVSYADDSNVIFYYDFEDYNAKGKPPMGFTDKNGGLWPTTPGSCSSYMEDDGNTALKVSPSITGPAVRLEFGKVINKGRYLFTAKTKTDFGSNIRVVLYFSDKTQNQRYSIDLKPSSYKGDYAKEKADSGDWAKINCIFDLDKGLISSWIGDDSSIANISSIPKGVELQELWPVLWDNVDQTKGLYLDDMKLEKLPLSVYLDTEKQANGNIFFDEDEQFIPIKFTNSKTMDETVKVEYYAVTRSGIEVYKSSEMLTIPAEGELDKIIYPDMKRFDTATLYVTAADSSGQTITTNVEFSHVCSADKLNPRYGIADHLSKGASMDMVGWLYDYQAKAGFGASRGDFEWMRAEKTKGTVTPLAQWSQVYKNQSNNGMDVMAILGLGNPLYDGNGVPYTKEGIDAFTKFSLAVADVAMEAIPDERHIYEIWNEADLAGTNFNPTNRSPQEIGTFISTVAKALKEKDKNAFILGGTQANLTGVEWTKAVLEAGLKDTIDAYSIHFYNHTALPETGGILDKTRNIAKIIHSYNPDLEIWLDESGEYSTIEQGLESRKHTLEDQAAFVPRLYMILENDGIVDRQYWYDYINDGDDPANAEHNYGLLKSGTNAGGAYAAKPSYLATAFMNKMILQGKHVELKEVEHQKRYINRYKRSDGKDMLVCWSVDNKNTVAIKSQNSVEAYDLYGNYLGELKPVDGVLNIQLSYQPIYLVGNVPETEICEPTVMCYNGYAEAVVDDAYEIKITSNNPNAYKIQPFPSANFKILDTNNCDSMTVALTNNAIEINNMRFNVLDQNDNIVLLGDCSMKKKNYPITVSISAKPFDNFNENRWCAYVKIMNNTQSLTFSGKAVLTNPTEFLEYAKSPRFENLKPQEEIELKINLPELVKKKARDVGVSILLDDGYQQELTKLMSFAVAKYADSPITIDGIKGENEYTGTIFRIGKEKWTQLLSDLPYNGNYDLSYESSMMWDEQFLYIYFDVLDDTHYNDAVDSSIWQGDGMQFGIADVAGNAIYDTEFTEMGCSLNNDGTVYWWKWSDMLGKSGAVENIETVIRRGNDGHTYYEAKVPWSEIVSDASDMKKYDEFGFNVLVNDNDGKGRKGYIEHSSGIGSGTKTSAPFHRIILQPSLK